MKNGKKRIILLVSALLLVGAPAAYAASSSIVKGTVLAYHYVVNNVKSTTAASKTQAITVDGKTYLPIEMVEEGTQTNLTVDSKSKTITFGEKNMNTPLQKLITNYNEYQATKNPAYTNIDGKSFASVLAAEEHGYRTLHLKPKAGYQTLHLEVATLQDVAQTESQQGDASAYTIIDADTNKDLFSFSAKVGEGIQSYDINIAGIRELKIQSYLLAFDLPTDVILPTSYLK
ncbi:hypothetical protein [Saccharibacillus qingshengii]|uniref:hypothetical protein n=1 Tax=Saccharibacillus qingshengii TaxID=1763540 RepID=UPI00155801B0|nr:hypothetical protein [Saccharibacillus qingshengii]